MLSCVVLINSVFDWAARVNDAASRSLRRSIAPIAAALYLVLFAIRQLSLLREEFRLSKFTLHSDLRRRAASRLALPCTSSFYFILLVNIELIIVMEALPVSKQNVILCRTDNRVI